MVLSNYEYFLRIAEYRNISKAAESLYIAQPTLTKYLQKLERDLDAQLFDRSTNPLRLTDAGQVFYEYVLQATRLQKDLMTRMDEVKNGGRATLTVGMALWRSSVLLPDFLPLFRQKHPLISFQLREGPGNVMEAALINDELDISIMDLPVNYANVSYEPILEEHVLLAGSRKFPLVQQLEAQAKAAGVPPRADLRDFIHEPFVLTNPGLNLTDYVNRTLSRCNIELPCVMRTSNLSTAINLAVSGMGYTFVPELGSRSQFFPANELATFLVNDPPLTFTLAAVYKKSRYLSAAAKVFIRELQEFCQQPQIHDSML